MQLHQRTTAAAGTDSPGMCPSCCTPGIAAVIYFSGTFNPDRAPEDPEAAAAVQLRNTKAAMWAMVLVYLGEHRAGRH